MNSSFPANGQLIATLAQYDPCRHLNKLTDVRRTGGTSGKHEWNYILGASVLVLVYSVFTGSPIPALFGGIALVTTVKRGGRQLLRRPGQQEVITPSASTFY